MPIRLLVCVTVLATLCTHSATLAVNYFWQNAAGGAFDEPSNWSPLVPQGPGGPNDTTHFDLGVDPANRYDVTDAGRENDRLVVHDDSLELTIFINHTLLSTSGNNPSLVVGAASGDTGDLILSSGGASVLETDVARIANMAGSTGVVRVNDLEWNGGNLRVGYGGSGSLTLENDAVVTSSNASLAHLAGSTGVATVQGGASWTTGGNLLIGREGVASLIITNGSSVTSAATSIGSESTGDGNVTVAGTEATFEATDSLTVGESGEGTISISSGGEVTSADTFVGRLSGADGHISLLSGGDWTITGRLSIGGDADTGVGGGVGLVEIDRGRLEVEQEIVLFANGELRLDDGSLDVATVTVQPGGEFNWTGGVVTVEQFNGDLINDGGVLAARGVTGTITIEGSYVQESGSVLSIGIAGEIFNNEFDSVVIDDTAVLDGELRFRLLDLFEPEPDAVYTILEATDLIGSFTNVANGERLTDSSILGSFVVHYGMGSPFDPHHVVLTDFRPILPGDYNDNGVVDAADYVMWRNNFGTENPLPNDPTGGTIGGDQYDIWLTNFGRTAPSGSLVNVPESATWLLATLSSYLVIARRRR